MENKPIVTCHGDQTLFASLHQSVVQGLPREPIKWHRSYGRPARSVRVEANFVPFNPDILPTDNDWTLLGRPFFHTYWTDCDLETYRSSVKEDIAEWLAALREANCPDWLIVVVLNEENKMKTKLLRQSVLDKVRSDFCSKQNDRCIVLTEPHRHDSRSSESWNQLLMRTRQLLLLSFNHNLLHFEEYMRAQRERRNEKGWSFSQYFLLQEELAFLFEMLGQYEDALVQYDELDALLTQFVLNHVAGASAEWVAMFTENVCRNWDGLCLSQPINIEKRHLIKKGRASLLDFRNYLFSRQCTLMFLMYRPEEVAQRSIPFMHNCIQELDSLEISMPEGSVSCWVFLSCMEVLNTCGKFRDSGQMEPHCLHTARLWDYARTKMHGLGQLCGLMPGRKTSSHHLNLVVDLIAGLSAAQDEAEPLAKLREALSSKEAFQKHYLELSELAMGTFKHIGRIRSARLIGRDLADFYMKMDEPAKAEGFLLDALKTYRLEGWRMLADHTRLLIARCQEKLDNTLKYVKSCCHVAASPMLKDEARGYFYEEIMRIAGEGQDHPLQIWARPMFIVGVPHTRRRESILNKECHITLLITNHSPQPIKPEGITLSMNGPCLEKKEEDPQEKTRTYSCSSSTSTASTPDEMDIVFGVKSPKVLDMEKVTEVKADKSVSSTGMVCNTEFKRMDSGQQLMKDTEVVKETGDASLQVDEDITLYPGENRVTVRGRLPATGIYQAGQLCIQVRKIEFYKNMSSGKVKLEVISETPSITVDLPQAHLLAGLPQTLAIKLQSGTQSFTKETQLRVTSSSGLQIVTPEKELMLPVVTPHSSHEINLSIVAQVPESDSGISHQLELSDGWLMTPHTEMLDFLPPLSFSHKLHTSKERKFIQVYVRSPHMDLEVTAPTITADNPDVSFQSLNKQHQTLTLNPDQTASYLWELKANISETPALKCTFSISYQAILDGDASQQVCTYSFSLQDYQTLFSVKSAIASSVKEEHCTMGITCQLRVTVSALHPSDPYPTNLIYAVEADEDTWMLSGRTTGVFELESSEYVTQLDVVPLCGGYLPLPRIKLSQWPGEIADVMDDESISRSPAKAVPLSDGQVFNSSAAHQVHVLPVPNTTHMDIA